MVERSSLVIPVREADSHQDQPSIRDVTALCFSEQEVTGGRGCRTKTSYSKFYNSRETNSNWKHEELDFREKTAGTDYVMCM